MAMAWYGQLASLQSDNDWDDYVESLDFFFIEISGTKGKEKGDLLSSCGTLLFKLFKSLSAPGKPSDKSYSELCALMGANKKPNPNFISKRYKFNSRVRGSGESVTECGLHC